ncbi:MAG: T9SS type A sorting domain-containing protein [Flavobacteriales bacterium]|nr:T9SS type A sorting domain-containing protein [Flavobacteriales bacterium]
MSTSTDYVIGVGVAADGAIYGHIHSGPPSNAPACMARLTSEGQTDASFNGNGVRCNLYGGNSGNSIGGIAVRSDGAALGAGSVSGGKVAAVLANGQFDSGFGTSGLATSPAGTNAWRTSGIGIRSDGRILVTTWKPTSPFSIQLAQLMPDGSPDPSFGTDGLALFTPQGMNISTWMSNAVIYPDGRIIISWGRFNSVASELDHAVSWFNADGSPHAIGTVITDLGPNSSDQDNARGLAMAPGGDIIALGSFVESSGGTAVLRFNGDLNTSSIAEEINAFALRVFPNPANEMLRVEWPGEARIERVVVRDASGRVVPSNARITLSAACIELAGMASGPYFVEVVVGDRMLRRLFVVER